MKIGPRLPKL